MKFSNLSNVYGSTYVVDDTTEQMDAMKNIIGQSDGSSSFYHLSIDNMMSKVDAWREMLPRVTPHYAVKCNSDHSVLRTLEIMGLSFDCASRGEIKTMLAMGVDPSRIIFASPCKVAGDVKYARAHHIKTMTFESPAELHKIAKLYPAASLLLQLRSDSLKTDLMLMEFGVLPEEARALLSLAAHLKLEVVGVALDTGSEYAEPKDFSRAIASAKKVFEDAIEEGHHPSVLHIGGGFMASNFSDAAECINEALDRDFPEGCGVEVTAAPSRYLASSAVTLATRVIEVTENPARVCIDDALYASLYDDMRGEPVLIQEACADEKKVAMSVWGAASDDMHQVLESVKLPQSVAVGEWLVWPDMGGSSFNEFASPSVIPHLSSNAEQRLLELGVGDCDSETSSGFVSGEEN